VTTFSSISAEVGPGIVIVGAGEAGTRAAFALRENGFDGAVTLIGEEPHLPYERPPLSKDALLAETPAPKTIADEARLAAAGIVHRRGVRVTAIDRDRRRLATEAGEDLPYDRLLLATGARPRRVLQGAAEVPHVAYLRSYGDALALRARFAPGERIIILGGGFIGLELAAAARRRGAEVTVIEILPRLLARVVPVAIAELVASRHRDGGVRLLTGTPVETIESAPGAVRVTLADGRRLEADLLVAGIGAVPETALAAAAGLALDNGIAADAQLRTSDPSIFAAGDCCSYPLALYGDRRIRLESWRSAQEHGATAAKGLSGTGEPHAAVPWFWSDQYDLTLQIAGLADEGTTHIRRDLGEGALLLFHLAADGRLVAASGIGVGNVVARDIRLAEMLIARRATPDPAALADPATRLKALLAA
jgi:3-phenylpropionate/trans-cinnamate dioxygenase ferredoxin reductase subunit